MNDILIMTDSASDITKEVEKELNVVRVINIPITINGKGYYEREDFTNDEFYKILNECDEIPTTAHITAPVFMEEFQKAYKEGYKDIIYVSINKNGSATYDASVKGKEMFFEENPDAEGKFGIHLVPSGTFSMGYGRTVIRAAEYLQKKSPSVDELVEFMKKEIINTDTVFVVPNLKFAKKSGRLSATATFMGEMMGIRPLLIFREGKSIIKEKIRGDKHIIPAICKYYEENVGEEDKDYMIITGENTDIGDELEQYIYEKTGQKALGKLKEGACIAINAGPQVLGISFTNKNKNEL